MNASSNETMYFSSVPACSMTNSFHRWISLIRNSLLCSQESEYRDVSHQWWQQVWSSYYPPPLQPPVMSADFISWLISMSIATTCLGCAVSTNQVWNIVVESTTGARDMLVMTKCHANAWFKRLVKFIIWISFYTMDAYKKMNERNRMKESSCQGVQWQIQIKNWYLFYLLYIRYWNITLLSFESTFCVIILYELCQLIHYTF